MNIYLQSVARIALTAWMLLAAAQASAEAPPVEITEVSLDPSGLAESARPDLSVGFEEEFGGGYPGEAMVGGRPGGLGRFGGPLARRATRWWDFDCSTASCRQPFIGEGCRSEGVFFNTDLVMLDVFQSEGDNLAGRLHEIRAPGAPRFGRVNPGTDPTARFAFGYQTCEGLGFQARFWEFENGNSLTIPQGAANDPNIAVQAWDVGVFDLEATKTLGGGIWDVKASGGYRFVEYEEGASLRLNAVRLAAVDTRYVGNGLTSSVAFRRPILRRFSVMYQPRASLLFGTKSMGTPVGVVLPANALNDSFDMRYVLESQLGAAFEHRTSGGGLWYARAGYEVQYWNEFVAPIGNQTDPSSTLLHGFFFAMGLHR